MKLFFSVGEPSGDLHGANLIREIHRLHPNAQMVGFGGPRMAAAGCKLHADLTTLAIMFFVRAILNIHKFYFLLRRADRYFREERPDAVILIDYPGFNWHVARKARQHGIPVFYYGVPQMWAWAGWRVNKLRRLVDHVLCKLPFEVPWFQARNCRATFVGHPYFDELNSRQLDNAFLESYASPVPLVTILPGSRTQEVHSNLGWILKAAARIQSQVPNVRFAVASYNVRQAMLAQETIAKSGLSVDVHVGRTGELIQLAHSCLACSGSVSLELMHHARPTVIVYYVRWWVTRLVATLDLIKVRYITLVNLMADDNPFCNHPQPFDPQAPGAHLVPFPEYPTCTDKSESIAAHVVEWLQQPQEHARRVAQLRELTRRFGQPGASRRAAQYIVDALEGTRAAQLRPAA